MKSFARISRKETLAALPDALILTVNQRLTRELLEEYAASHLSAGRKAWIKPSIFSWDNWLRSMLKQLGRADELLTEAQELTLWQRVINETLTDEQKLQLQIPVTAKTAREAHRLLSQYAADFNPENASNDHRTFLKWRKGWTDKLKTLGCLDSTGLIDVVRDGIRCGRLNLPEHVILAGFDDLRPDQLLFLQSLQDSGVRVQLWPGAGEKISKRIRMSSPAIDDEIRACARWSRKLLLGGDCRIGVIVQEPHVYRARMEEIFLSELAPEALLSGLAMEGLYSFSLGAPLSEESIVTTALHILSLGDTIHFDEICYLLRSPWLGHLKRDGEQRVRLELGLRESSELYWTPRNLQKFRVSMPTGQRPKAAASFLSSVAAQISESLALKRKKFPSGYWSVHFKKLLGHCGWPGARKLTSRDYQAREEFFEVLDELSSLDRLGSPMTRNEAASFVARRCQERIFQVKQAAGSIQVMGLLEASGLDFDHIWLLGFHDGVFPAAASPNPFIPVPLQRNLGMPHADAERELDFARQVSDRLFSCADNIVASYPLFFEGAERQPSPFIQTFDATDLELDDSCDPLMVVQSNRPTLEQRVDLRAPTITSNKVVSGGTSLLKDQALCPFRGFAHHRLRSEALRTLDVGINHLQRGTLTHSLLEQFWRKAVAHATLCTMTEEELNKALHDCAVIAFKSLRKQAGHEWPRDLKTIEIDRLVDLAREWLEVEKERTPFEVIEFEKDKKCRLGKLEIRTKVDRVDRLDSGGIAIIDYKTGKCEPERWFGERMSEPQLPIYTQEYTGESIEAVVFAQVRRDECRFTGVTTHADDFPKVPSRSLKLLLESHGLDLASLLDRWREVLVNLADDFVTGDARVLPLDDERTCEYCDYPTLCRIVETRHRTKGLDDE